MRSPKAVYFILFLSIVFDGFAQTHIKPEYLTVEGGLSQGWVASMLQSE